MILFVIFEYGIAYLKEITQTRLHADYVKALSCDSILPGSISILSSAQNSFPYEL